MSTTEPVKSATALRLSEARNVLGFTAIDVSEHMGISLSDLEAYEAGTKPAPTAELRRFARLYRRDISWLLGVTADAEIQETLLASVDKLSEVDREAVLSFARFLASKPSPTI